MGLSAQARERTIENAITSLEESGTRKESIRLSYKEGTEGPFPVITVPVKAVLYNHRSHRIRSQLESHPKRQLVVDDPYSDAAQKVIHEILAETEHFEELKSNLKEHNQREPGVITRSGLLVNANRRLAALRELEFDYICAAVLPSDADELAIDRLELDLQVQRDFKEKYTFTNELIFVDELLRNYGYSEEMVAKALNWAASSDEKELRRGVETVRKNVRLFALVREIQSLSGNIIPLTYFDDKRQALIDIDDDYQRSKMSDPAGAEHKKNAGILAVLSGSGYRELRRIDADSTLDIFLPGLKEAVSLGEELDTITAPSTNGTDDEEVGILRELVKLYAVP